MIFWSFQSFLSALISFTSFVILYIIYKYAIKVYLQMRYYQKQGAIPIFNRNVTTNRKNAIEKGDFYFRYKKLAAENPEAKCFVENIGNKVVLIPIQSTMVKEFLSRYDVYHKAVGLVGINQDLVKGALTYVEGTRWKKQRKHLSTAFHYEFLKTVIPMIVEVTQEKFDTWIKNEELGEFDVAQRMTVITGEVVGRFFFGRRFSKETLWGVSLIAAAQKMFRRVEAEIQSRSNALFGANFARMGILKRHRELMRDIKEFRAKCRGIIEEVDKSGVKEQNLLNIYLKQRESESPDERLTNDQIVGRFVGTILAGTDTTSFLLSSVLYNMDKYPDTAKKVKEEIDKEIIDNSSFTMETLNKLEYTTAFIKETLRYGSSVPGILFRTAVKDDDLCGIHVKKGTLLTIYNQIPHYSEDDFSRPYEFLPERWIPDERAKDNTLKSNDNAFFSFSAGPRNCIGQHFAITETKIILIMFLKTFDIECPKDYKMVVAPMVPLTPFIVKLRPKNTV